MLYVILEKSSESAKKAWETRRHGGSHKEEPKKKERIHPKVMDWAMKEAVHDKRWAKRAKGLLDEKSASDFTLQWRDKLLKQSIPEIAQHHYDYLKMRAHSYSKRTGDHIDREAKRQWERLTGRKLKPEERLLIKEITEV